MENFSPTPAPKQKLLIFRKPSFWLVVGVIFLFFLLRGTNFLDILKFSPWGLNFYNRLYDGVTIFLGIFIEAFSFVILGVIFSSLVQVFVKSEWITKVLPRNTVLSALSVSLLGVIFPVCECGNIPLARRLLRKGIPLSSSVALLLAAPVVNPIVIASTFAAFRSWPFVGWRIGLTLFIAVIVALVIAPLNKRPQKALSASFETSDDCHHIPEQKRWHRTLQNSLDELFEMTSVLIYGSFIAAAIQVVVPRGIILTIGANPVLSIFAMMLLAFIISICANVDAFFALSYTSTFTNASLLSFLVFGPMVDIKSLFMLKKIFRPRLIAVIVVLAATLTFTTALIYNHFLS